MGSFGVSWKSGALGIEGRVFVQWVFDKHAESVAYSFVAIRNCKKCLWQSRIVKYFMVDAADGRSFVFCHQPVKRNDAGVKSD